jgi:hypothetical protein
MPQVSMAILSRMRSVAIMRDTTRSRPAVTGPNPLPPEGMTPAERRAELCRLLATGLVRLRLRDRAQLSAKKGDFSLHNSANQSGHATSRKRRNA